MAELSGGDRRQQILEAAARVVETSGARHLTMDAVAKAAAASKGGVLYHFPSKRALLEGMLDRLLEQLQASAGALREQHADAANPGLVAWVLAEREQSARDRSMSRAILAAAAEDPKLLAAARTLVESLFEDAGRGAAPAALGWVILLAAEGLRFLDMLDLLPLSASQRRQVQDELMRLASERDP